MNRALGTYETVTKYVTFMSLDFMSEKRKGAGLKKSTQSSYY